MRQILFLKIANFYVMQISFQTAKNSDPELIVHICSTGNMILSLELFSCDYNYVHLFS